MAQHEIITLVNGWPQGLMSYRVLLLFAWHAAVEWVGTLLSGGFYTGTSHGGMRQDVIRHVKQLMSQAKQLAKWLMFSLK